MGWFAAAFYGNLVRAGHLGTDPPKNHRRKRVAEEDEARYDNWNVTVTVRITGTGTPSFSVGV